MPWTVVVKIPDKPCRGPTILLDQVGNAFQDFWPPAEPDRDWIRGRTLREPCPEHA
jgi:hypothetical protein